MKTPINTTIGSTFIEFEDVRVPIDNLLGQENKGFPLIMSSELPYQGLLSATNLFFRL
jgi:alkylation response protein AidB-like acyl-CoA dehydrogenase